MRTSCFVKMISEVESTQGRTIASESPNFWYIQCCHGNFELRRDKQDQDFATADPHDMNRTTSSSYLSAPTYHRHGLLESTNTIVTDNQAESAVGIRLARGTDASEWAITAGLGRASTATANWTSRTRSSWAADRASYRHSDDTWTGGCRLNWTRCGHHRTGAHVGTLAADTAQLTVTVVLGIACSACGIHVSNRS